MTTTTTQPDLTSRQDSQTNVLTPALALITPLPTSLPIETELWQLSERWKKLALHLEHLAASAISKSSSEPRET